MEKYVVLDKAVGQTPLECAEIWRTSQPNLADTPLAYAGRLDPMASGKLLILIGDECKNQTNYHGLDKAYDFSVLFGIESDSLDMLGRLTTCDLSDSFSGLNLGPAPLSGLEKDIRQITQTLVGEVSLPYPIFSSKTVQGKPLHTWTLEGRLDEITIPTKQSTIYSLEHTHTATLSKTDVVEQALAKVNSVAEVTDERKAIGNDFRRVDVRKDWDQILNNDDLPENYYIAHFSCIASSGTYMRTLASVIAQKLSTCGLAWSIHRTKIGTYDADSDIWSKWY